MLFIALTRSGVLESLAPHSARQFPVGPGWYLTCATDDFVSRLAVSEDEIVVSESLLASWENRDHDVPFVTARFLRSLQILEIFKSTVSGRPVFFSTSSKGEFFLSTHVAWLRRAGLPIEEDPNVLPELLAYRAVGPPRTLFRGIRQLRLAGSLAVHIAGGDLQVKEHPVGYDPPDPAGSNAERNPAGTIANLLNMTVARLMPAAPRVATLLSGGVDSSILAAAARDVLSACDTYSTAFPFDSPSINGEQKYALSAASALSTRHTLFTPTANDYVTGFVEALANAEAPLHHLQSVLLHLLFKSGMPDRMDRIICGEAADSTFGTATHFMLRLPRDLRGKICSLPPVYAGLRALGSCWQKARDFSGVISQYHSVNLPLTDPSNPLWGYAAYGDFEWIRTHYGTSREEIIAPRAEYFRRMGNRGFNDALSIYTLNFDVVNTAVVWSKLAEEQRKILYFPFASADVLDAAFSIPWETKLKSEKHVIRGVGRKLGVPELILNRPKQSFGIMSDRWAVKDGPLEPLISVAAKVVDIKQLRSLQGAEPRKAMTLWSLLNYAVLKRLLVMGESKESLIDEVVNNCGRQNGRRPRTHQESSAPVDAAEPSLASPGGEA
jgi:asparagine synthetase B (glutamine-hydrolysing)